MNTADVAAEVKCLRRLIGMRCANVYDLSPKVYAAIACCVNSFLRFLCENSSVTSSIVRLMDGRFWC